MCEQESAVVYQVVPPETLESIGLGHRFGFALQFCTHEIPETPHPHLTFVLEVRQEDPTGVPNAKGF